MFSITTSAFPRIGLKTIAWATVVSLVFSTACTTSRYVIVKPNEVDFTDNVRVLTLKDGSTVEFPSNTGIYDKTCDCFRSTSGYNISVPVDSVDNANVYRTVTSDKSSFVVIGVIAGVTILVVGTLSALGNATSFRSSSRR